MFPAIWRLCCLSLISGGIIPAAFAAETQSTASGELPIHRQAGGWKRVETENFHCWSLLPDEDARQLALSCELWRAQLQKTWLSQREAVAWTPKCEVVVHPQRDDYNRALNRLGDMSVGSTRMNFDQGRVVLRRIDVRADASDWSNAALPHELTHVVLGDRFGGRSLPRWADEGIAMLSESLEKHQVRLANLKVILTQQQTLRVSDLVRMQFMPERHQLDAFYGQSLALSSLLIRKSTPARFADFVEDAMQQGFDPALQRHYQMSGVAALEQEWKAWTKQPHDVSFVSLPIQTPPATDVTTAVSP